jgi:hypothetical protein
MLFTLAFRHLWVRKIRSFFLLFGFALGVGVMVVLLSVGEAMLDQSRDVSLIGGGEITILPQGIDIDAMRTGGAGGMFFTIDRAPFLTRQVLGGRRRSDLVRTVSPVMENKLVYLCSTRPDCRPTAVRAGGEIPSRADAVGAGLDVLRGSWKDSPADSGYISPSPQQLYDEIDRFHIPLHADSTWAEWQYYNVAVGPGEWWYITYLVGGDVRGSRWGGRVLLTHRRPNGGYERFTSDAGSAVVTFDTSAANLTIGPNQVRQRNGTYVLRAVARGETGAARVDLTVHPTPERYFPPVQLSEKSLVSGYAVPALAASATGTLCVARRCTRVQDITAYHDHNWGVWRDVTWEWGATRGDRTSVLYGGISQGESAGSPLFLALLDSLGVRQILRCSSIDYEGSQPAAGLAGARAPERFSLVASRLADTLRLEVDVADALATGMTVGGMRRAFLQMRGSFRLAGKLDRKEISDSGTGFFETYVRH